MDYIWTLALSLTLWPVSRHTYTRIKIWGTFYYLDFTLYFSNIFFMAPSYDFSICAMLTLGRLKILQTFQTFCQLKHSIIRKQWKRLFLLDFLTKDLLLNTDKNWIFIPFLSPWVSQSVVTVTIQYNAGRYFPPNVQDIHWSV